jgi:hypothetical protein
MVKQKKRSFSYTDPYGMQQGCPAASLVLETHSFCFVDEWVRYGPISAAAAKQSTRFQNRGNWEANTCCCWYD